MLSDHDLERIRRAADRDEIRQLAYRYAWSLDVRDGAAMSDLYVSSLREKMHKRFDKSMSQVGVTVLFVGNHIIDFAGPDASRGLVYCRGYIDTRSDSEPDRFVEQAILYRDIYRRENGVWLFQHRTHELWYGVVTSEHPMNQRAANWPDHDDGVGTVPYDEPTWRDFWNEKPL